MQGLLGSIKTIKLRDEVVSRIRSAIVLGKLTPGQRLTEEDLARELGVSRSPVREALAQLEREGLVVSPPNRGTFVRQLTPQEVRELFSVRAALETLAAEWALPNLVEADLRTLEDLLEQQDAARKSGGVLAVVHLDLQFHQAIFVAARNQLLLKLWGELRGQMLMLFSLNTRVAWAEQASASGSNPDHIRLLQALRAHDLAAFADVTREINRRVAEELCQIVQAASTDLEG